MLGKHISFLQAEINWYSCNDWATEAFDVTIIFVNKRDSGIFPVILKHLGLEGFVYDTC